MWRVVISLTAILMLSGACSGNKSSSATPPATGISLWLEKYWDSIPYKGDADNDDNLDDMEQHIVDYLYVASSVDSITALSAMSKMVDALPGPHPLRTVADYLFEYDSPIHNLALLRLYLMAVVANAGTTQAEKERAGWLLNNVSKNMPGGQIADLPLIISALSEHPLPAMPREITLHGLLDKLHEDTILLFYDPDCENCKEFILNPDRIPSSVSVIAISVSNDCSPLPENWTSTISSSPEILDENFYLPSLPQIYHLSPQRIIIPL